ncbi:UNVERIFIED_CONTAM: hypothetical protein B566_EDAN018870 [Ephemera danica]|nr:hypothetical protein B566_EDAN018870 [Ephemera danica]
MSKLDSSIVSVEEFVPDGGGLDHSFLDEPVSVSNPVEPETNNPLVAGFQDDVDPDDFPVPPVPVLNPVKIRESPASSSSSVEDLRYSTVASNWAPFMASIVTSHLNLNHSSIFHSVFVSRLKCLETACVR